jgi:hypothetical protein
MAVTTLLNQPSAMTTANGNTSDISWGTFKELALDAICTNKQGTSPTLQIIVERKDAAGNYNQIHQITQSVSAATVGTPVNFIASIGVGCSINQSFGSMGRIRWVIGGSATPGAAFNLSLIAK